MQKPSVTILRKKSYLAMVRNAAKGENHMFRNNFAVVDGVERDIVDDGALSCTYFLSGVLYMHKLIGDMHANIAGLERDLEASGWKPVDEPREGAILVWEARPPVKERPWEPTQLHAGVYIGDERAVSNGSNSTLMPEEHHYTYDGTRKVIRIWWHDALET